MFKSREDCEHRKYENTNPRYKHFCQTYFTAGDEEQFEDTRTHQDLNDDIPSYKSIPINVSDLYCNTTADVSLKTFRYIFNKFKKGIYISIRNNKISTFLPFSKSKFINEWSDQIHVEPRFKTIVDFAKYISILEKRQFSEHNINKFINHWYGNNCLLRYEFPLKENDTGVHHIKSMFEELCENETIPDIDFFVNRRDFPLLKCDKTEPYNHIWDSHSKPLVSHSYDKYLPILSSSITQNFADIAIPTLDDWARIKYNEGIYFPKTHTRVYDTPIKLSKADWDLKKYTAVFRGASTGVYTTIEQNPRLKIAYLSTVGKKDIDNLLFIDAGITDWNIRPRKIQGEKYLKTIEIDKLPFKLVPKLTMKEQSRYKYIIHIDGHVSAFRLSLEMGIGSLILKVASAYKLWYSDMLQPYVHYVPISEDLSDIYDKIRWCKENDEKCFEIVKNARDFYETYLSKKGIFNYLKSVLCTLKDKIGKNYHYFDAPTQPIPFQLLPAVECHQKLLSTKLTCIYRNENTIIKTTTDPKKIRENIHEAFIGTHIINNLAKVMPNFIHTKGLDVNNSVISEYIEGESFFAWLQSSSFKFSEMIEILSHISLAIHQAQLRYGFVHNDLFPWNVMLKRCDSPVKTTYVMKCDVAITVESCLIPVIIDYGKSHVVYKGKHCGFINMYKFDSIIDVLSILFSTVSVIMKAHRFDKKEDVKFVNLLNFVAETSIYNREFKTFQDVMKFVFDNASFSHLITLDTKEFGKKTPFDFCMYLHTIYKTKLIVENKITFQPKNISIQKISHKTKNFKEKLSIYYLFQQLANIKLIDMFKEKLKVATFRQYKKSDMSIKIDDVDYLNKYIKIPIPTLGDENMLYHVLLYKGPFELSEEDRVHFSHCIEFV